MLKLLSVLCEFIAKQFQIALDNHSWDRHAAGTYTPAQNLLDRFAAACVLLLLTAAGAASAVAVVIFIVRML